MSRARVPPRALGLLLGASLPPLLLLSLSMGPTGGITLAHAWTGLLGLLELGPGLDGADQTILELRLWRVLTTAGVGAALGLSGALVQGLFRNGLAAPSVIGVTGGASLGATAALLIIGGYGGALLTVTDAGALTLIVPLFGFVGALAAATLVTLLGTPGGRLSVPALLLTGIAVNTAIAGLLSLISALVLEDWEVSRALMNWTFGTLEDRTGWHALTVWMGMLPAAAAPFVAWELDLLQAGDEDAASLGVSVGRVRVHCLLAASLAAASAVAVAGQIAFVGLIVPHLVRQASGSKHRSLLPLSLLSGAVFLLSIEWINYRVLGQEALPPGVVMSLVGGPAFIVLLMINRREIETW